METDKLLLAKYSTLESERLLLRPVRLSDAEGMFAYTSDVSVVQYLNMDIQTTLEEAIDGIATYFMADPLGKYGIELKATGAFIGTIDLRVDSAHRKAEVGYVLAAAFQGKGYMTEAVQALLAFGFDKMNLERIDSYYWSENEASGKVMERVGMSREGILRKALYKKDAFHDLVMYAILKEDYKQL